MQTFLPYPSYELTAKCLDPKRLGNQRNEALVLLNGGWPHHPASKMWGGYLYSLADYGIAICQEWMARGNKDTCLARFLSIQGELIDTGAPSWLGLEEFHASHRANLLRKNYEWYSQFGWTEDPTLPYVWPVPERQLLLPI